MDRRRPRVKVGFPRRGEPGTGVRRRLAAGVPGRARRPPGRSRHLRPLRRRARGGHPGRPRRVGRCRDRAAGDARRPGKGPWLPPRLADHRERQPRGSRLLPTPRVPNGGRPLRRHRPGQAAQARDPRTRGRWHRDPRRGGAGLRPLPRSRRPEQVALEPVQEEEKSVLANLLQLYRHDFSPIRGFELTEHGTSSTATSTPSSWRRRDRPG